MSTSSGLGDLARLPPEIRQQIFANVLVASKSDQANATWGHGSRLSISILLVSRQVYAEAVPILYETPHKIRCAASVPPTDALRRMHRVTFEVRFQTHNRGDYEESIERPHLVFFICERVGFSLRHNTVLKELQIVLLNENQRKRGPKPLRSQAVKSNVQRMLLPFATLPASIPIEITGFDTLDFAEMFDGMRLAHAGSAMPISMLMNDLDKRGSLRQTNDQEG